MIPFISVVLIVNSLSFMILFIWTLFVLVSLAKILIIFDKGGKNMKWCDGVENNDRYMQNNEM